VSCFHNSSGWKRKGEQGAELARTELIISHRRPAMLQSALCAAEGVSHVFWISHAINLVIIGEPLPTVVFMFRKPFRSSGICVVVRQRGYHPIPSPLGVTPPFLKLRVKGLSRGWQGTLRREEYNFRLSRLNWYQMLQHINIYSNHSWGFAKQVVP